MLFAKRVPSAEQVALEAILDRQSATIRSAIRTFLADVRTDEVIRAIRELLERSQYDEALRIVDTHVVRLGTVIPKVFMAVASAQANRINEDVARIAVAFDPGDPQAAELMRQNQLQFVVGFQQQQREATRNAIVQGIQEGLGARQMARRFVDSIGLTAGQEAAVQNYRRLLREGSNEALSRDLRDRRFDPTIRAASAAEPIPEPLIDRMVERYRARSLQYRSEVIARTEALRVSGAAREEAFRQTLIQANIDEALVERTWMATLDSRVRDTHRAMNGQKRKLNEAFQSPSGALLMFPGDPNAPAIETVNCFPAGTDVEAIGINKGYRHWYEGDLIEIKTASGRRLAGTPNHPILTPSGWVGLGFLNEGDSVVCGSLSNGSVGTRPDVQDVPTSIDKVFNALARVGSLVRTIGRDVDFHGDGTDREIDIVFSAGFLREAGVSSQRQPSREFFLPFADSAATRLGQFGQNVIRALYAENSGVSIGDLVPSFLFGHRRPFDGLCLATSANGYAGNDKQATDGATFDPKQFCEGILGLAFGVARDNIRRDISVPIGAGNAIGLALRALRDIAAFKQKMDRHSALAETLGNFALAQPGEIKTDDLVSVRRFKFAAHVYNLETDSGWYIANGIIAHNCRCVLGYKIKRA